MYIPVSYWQSGISGNPHMRVNAYNTTFAGPGQLIRYTYDGTPYTASTVANLGIIPVCLDAQNSTKVDTALSNTLTAGASFFCTAAVSGTIDINSYPKTGPEAWYIDVSYVSAGDDGLFYYNYIDQNGNIINDTISFGQTKRIISQTNPLNQRLISGVFQLYISWTIVGRFPGQVLAYPYKDAPANYTFTLKRADINGDANFFPTYTFETYNTASLQSTNSGSFSLSAAATGIGSTITFGTINPPVEMPNNNGRRPPSSWITSVTPVPKNAFLLSSCLTTHSLWATFDDYTFYNTGSVLKVNNPELTATSSCWTVTNLTSSVSTSVSLTNLDVSASYAAGFCLNCLGFANEVIATGGTTGSFLSGSTLYRYNAFSTNGTFNIVSGSITDGKLMVIAGGGGGGNEAGGGAGGLIYSSSLSMNTGSYSVVVGTGGTPFTNGNDSSFIGGGYNVVTIGGGKGAQYTSPGTTNGGNGGSGGGGNFGGSAGTGTAGQGFDGGGYGTISGIGWSGGGGGAGSPGQTRFGGAGRQLGTLMFGVSTTYAEGGDTLGGTISTGAGSGGQASGGSGTPQTGLNGLVVITYPAFY